MNEKVSEVFSITRQPTKSGHKNIGSQPWFNTECHEAKKDFNRNRNQYCRTKSDVTRRNFVNTRKNTIRLNIRLNSLLKSKKERKLVHLHIQIPDSF